MSPASTPTAASGAELLVDSLLGHGIDTVFGVPGDTGVVLYDVLASRTADIRHVLARDERHAGYMADACVRTTRRLAVCEASSGAGAVYLASGLGEAFASSIPVVAVTTDIHRRSRDTGAISDIDQMALFSSVTKWRRRAERAADVPGLVADAVAAATTGRPGPVALILPEDVLEETADVPATAGVSVVPAGRAKAAHEAVQAAAARLASAERPVIVAGGGVHLSGAWPELALLAEHAAIPVGTTIHGKGALPEHHSLALGVVGANGARDYANAYLAGSDAVLFVGTRANSTDTNGFTCPPRETVRVAQVDIDGARAGRNFPGSVSLVGDAAAVLGQIRAELRPAGAEVREQRLQALLTERRQWELQAVRELPTAGPERLQPRDVIRVLYEVFGDTTWVVADCGTPTPYLSSYWQTAGDAWRVVIPRGHGPMGYAIPASIGVAVAHPGERVLCLTTEGSVAMGVGDWETAGRLRLPITYVVLDNVSMAWIKMIQHLFLGKRYFGVDPGPIYPARLAEGMDLPGARARDLDQLQRLAKASADRDGPSVIHVTVPEHKDSPPPVAPWQAALSGATTERPIH